MLVSTGKLLGRVAVITGSRIVPLNRPASVLSGNALSGNADAGTW